VETFPLKFISTIKYQDASIAASPGSIASAESSQFLPFHENDRKMGEMDQISLEKMYSHRLVNNGLYGYILYQYNYMNELNGQVFLLCPVMHTGKSTIYGILPPCLRFSMI
jgi:hypothetical protein